MLRYSHILNNSVDTKLDEVTVRIVQMRIRKSVMGVHVHL